MKPCSDDRGTVMLSGLTMAIVLIALLYATLGVGKTILEQQGMQDAADASAFSAAVFQARGMNLIAFINLVMAALVAVLVALRLAQSFCVMLAGFMAGIAWLTGGASMALATLSAEKAVTLEKAFHQAKKVILPTIEGLHVTQRAVRVVVPWVAMTDAMVEASQHHAPAKGAFALPGAVTLPVEADKFPVICEHSNEMIAELVFWPLEQMGAPSLFLDPLKDAIGDLGNQMSQFLCGSGAASPPSYTQKYDQRRPLPTGHERCKTAPQSSACRNARQLVQESTPHFDGSCPVGRDCSYYGAYERMARRARLACGPRGAGTPKQYLWQKREIAATFVYGGGSGGWRESSRSVRSTRLVESEEPPCGPDGLLNDEWNHDSGPDSAAEPQALCKQQLTLPGRAAPGASRTATYFEALRVFSCTVEIKEKYQLAKKGDAFDSPGKKRSPHKVDAEVQLGGEAFQIRSLAFGPKPGPGDNAKLVELAAWQQDSDDWAGWLAHAGRLSVAQAEFFFDHAGDVPRSEWMWDLRWTARLRRFRLPDARAKHRESQRAHQRARGSQADLNRYGGMSPTRSPEKSCEAAGATSCSGLSKSLSVFDRLVVH